MSWRNFKNSQFKDKSYEKAHISTCTPRGNKDKRCKSLSFEPFEPFGLKDKTENLVIPVCQSPEELETAQDFQSEKIIILSFLRNFFGQAKVSK